MAEQIYLEADDSLRYDQSVQLTNTSSTILVEIKINTSQSKINARFFEELTNVQSIFYFRQSVSSSKFSILSSLSKFAGNLLLFFMEHRRRVDQSSR